jgi:trehalose transport system permease protein
MKGIGRRLWWYGGGLCAIVFTLVPLYLMVKISISPPHEVLTPHPTFGIRTFTPDHWRAMLASDILWPPLGKSLAVATWTMLGAVVLAAPAAYVMSRQSQPLRYGMLLVLFASRMVPEVGIALPVAVRFLNWGLLDTQLGLALALTHALPRPRVTYWAQLDRALTGAFREIVYDGQPVQATLERYHRQIQQARQSQR